MIGKLTVLHVVARERPDRGNSGGALLLDVMCIRQVTKEARKRIASSAAGSWRQTKRSTLLREQKV
jgi:hypothetical protein